MTCLNKMISNIKMYRSILNNVRKRNLTNKVIKSWEKKATWQMSKEERKNIVKATWIPNKKDVKKK